MNIKNFFPNVKDEYFTGIYEALIEVGEFGAVKMDNILSEWKAKYPKNWQDLAYQKITTKGANNIKKKTQQATEETACGFSMIKREEDFDVFETFIETFGVKQGAKQYQDHINRRREEFEKIREKFPNTREVSQKY